MGAGGVPVVGLVQRLFRPEGHPAADVQRLAQAQRIFSGYRRRQVPLHGGDCNNVEPVSYTHLDVYKRQWQLQGLVGRALVSHRVCPSA